MATTDPGTDLNAGSDAHNSTDGCANSSTYPGPDTDTGANSHASSHIDTDSGTAHSGPDIHADWLFVFQR
jgi:hypothetical protein